MTVSPLPALWHRKPVEVTLAGAAIAAVEPAWPDGQVADLPGSRRDYSTCRLTDGGVTFSDQA
jgi:hypothetical protein